MVLAWSESACAVYANSVLAARTNRNGAIIDLLSNIAGKTPFTGLITDQGRKANCVVEVATVNLPNPQLLGAYIGSKVQTGVPYITGLDRFLGAGIHSENIDYIQEMCAIIATYSAIDLCHVENITPEAVALNRQLILADHSTFSISSEDLRRYQSSYPDLWSDSQALPIKCFIGCPHLSLRQINWWAENIHNALQVRDQKKVSVETVICAAPGVINKFKTDRAMYSKLINTGVMLSPTCSETLFETGYLTGKPIITNSNKLRAYTSARFYADQQLVEVIVNGVHKGDSK
jgi:predicted aconitase